MLNLGTEVNEKEFEKYLKDEKTAKSFILRYKEKQLEQEKELEIMKAYSNDGTYAVIFELNWSHISDLSQLNLSKNNEAIAIYFKEKNILVFNSTYHIGNLKEACQSIKVLSAAIVWEEMFNEINGCIWTLRENLKKKYKHLKEEIKAKAERNKTEIIQDIVKEQESNKEFLPKYHFENERNYKMLYDYITNTDEFIARNVNRCLDEETNVKETILYLLAKEERQRELVENIDVLKARRIYKLLNGELSQAKKVWVVDSFGNRNQVENKMTIEFYELSIGGYREEVKIENIQELEYSKKNYHLLETVPVQ
jgi:hypothetical protein